MSTSVFGPMVDPCVPVVKIVEASSVVRRRAFSIRHRIMQRRYNMAWMKMNQATHGDIMRGACSPPQAPLESLQGYAHGSRGACLTFRALFVESMDCNVRYG